MNNLYLYNCLCILRVIYEIYEKLSGEIEEDDDDDVINFVSIYICTRNAREKFLQETTRYPRGVSKQDAQASLSFGKVVSYERRQKKI